MQHDDEGILDLEGTHWSFVVDLYQRPEVSPACLLLQDMLEVDVCLLLFALFVAREHRAILDKASLVDLDQAIGDWRGEVVRPLRAIRRRLKTGPMPAPDPATHALREQIKTAEINAEQIEFALLARHFHRRGHAVSAETIDVMTVLDGVVVFFAAQGKTAAAAVPGIHAALRDIAHAMAQP